MDGLFLNVFRGFCVRVSGFVLFPPALGSTPTFPGLRCVYRVSVGRGRRANRFTHLSWEERGWESVVPRER